MVKESASIEKLSSCKLGRSRTLRNMSTSKANASWDAPGVSHGLKLSRHATVALIGIDGMANESSSSEDSIKRAIDESTSTDQLRRKWKETAEITHLLSMLRSNTFVGAVQPEDHARWFQPSPTETKRQKVAMTC